MVTTCHSQTTNQQFTGLSRIAALHAINILRLINKSPDIQTGIGYRMTNKLTKP